MGLYSKMVLVIGFFVVLAIFLSPESFEQNISKTSEVPQIINSIVEQLLVSINVSDYANFIQPMSSDARAQVSEDSFNELSDVIKYVAGDYIEKSFRNTIHEQGFISYVYIAQFVGDNVTIVATFLEDSFLVEGFAFNSEKFENVMY